MKNKLSILFISLLGIQNVDSSDWKLGVEASYARISGVEAHEASHNANSLITNDKAVPSFLVKYDGFNNAQVTLRYTDFSDIRSSGFSHDADIFDDQDFSPQIPTAYRFEERIQEFAASYLFTLVRTKNGEFRIGPNLSYFDSKVDFASRSYSSHALQLGIESSFEIDLNKNTSAGLRYRFSNPPGHDIHLFSLGVNLKI